MNWLITGGCGFIGRSLIKQLTRKGASYIRVLDNLQVGSKDDLAEVCDFSDVSSGETGVSPGRVELITGDILDEKLALEMCSEIDVIVHLAANTGVGPSVEDPRQDCFSNVIGTLNYLEGARANSVKRFVFASSGAPAGECKPPIHEELPPHPVSPYGASKLAGEGYCSAYYRTFGIETVALRFSNVYGPLSSKKSSVVAKFIKRSLSGKSVEVYGDGLQTRDFIFIDDLVRAIELAAEIPGAAGETFQIATAAETTILELIQELKTVFGKKVADVDFSYELSEPRLGDVMRNYSDTSKARNILKWQADTILSEGLGVTLDWFIEQGR